MKIIYFVVFFSQLALSDTPYETLGVHENATPFAIIKAYKEKEAHLKLMGRWVSSGKPTPEALELVRALFWMKSPQDRELYDSLNVSSLYGEKFPLSDPKFLAHLRAQLIVIRSWDRHPRRNEVSSSLYQKILDKLRANDPFQLTYTEPTEPLGAEEPFSFTYEEVLQQWKVWVRYDFSEFQRKNRVGMQGMELAGIGLGAGALLGSIPLTANPPHAAPTLLLGTMFGIVISAPAFLAGAILKQLTQKKLLRVYVTQKWGEEGAYLAGMKPLYLENLGFTTKTLDRIHRGIWKYPFILTTLAGFVGTCAAQLIDLPPRVAQTCPACGNENLIDK